MLLDERSSQLRDGRPVGNVAIRFVVDLDLVNEVELQAARQQVTASLLWQAYGLPHALWLEAGVASA